MASKPRTTTKLNWHFDDDISGETHVGKFSISVLLPSATSKWYLGIYYREQLIYEKWMDCSPVQKTVSVELLLAVEDHIKGKLLEIISVVSKDCNEFSNAF